MAPFSDEVKEHSPTENDISQYGAPTEKNVCARRTARDWSSYLTKESAARRPSALKAAFQHLSIPGIISLGGGLPLPAYFPIHDVTVTVPHVGKWSEEETALEGAAINIVKYAHQQPRVVKSVRKMYTNGLANKVDEAGIRGGETMPTVGLSSTLQYGIGTGDPHLLSFLKQHTQFVHNPPYEDWATTLTCGNTYSFYACLRMLVERGDYVIMEEYAYSSAISGCGPMGIKIVGIEMDEQGMTATGLDTVLSAWDTASRGARKPRVIYLVP
jgi:aromatic amino acid aminotransferase I / 2-aminoadipate transaminase